PTLAETSYITCPRCTGTGHIRGTESSALHILRIIEEEAMKENTAAVHLQAPVDVATYLLNEKRIDIARIELRHKIQLVIVPNRHMETPTHEITRLRHDQLNQDDVTASYQLAQQSSEEVPASRNGDKGGRQEAAVKYIPPAQPTPGTSPAEGTPQAPGLITRFMHWLGGLSTGDQREKEKKETAPPASRESRPRNEQRRNSERGNERRNARGDRGSRSENNRTARTEKSEKGEKSALAQEKPQRQPKAPGEGKERPEAPARASGTDNTKTNRRRRRDKTVVEEDASASDQVVQPAAPVSALQRPAEVAEIEQIAATPPASDKPDTPVDGTEPSPEKRRRRSRGSRRGRSSAETGETTVESPETSDSTPEETLPVVASPSFDASAEPLVSTPDTLPVAIGQPFEPQPEHRISDEPISLPLIQENDAAIEPPATIAPVIVMPAVIAPEVEIEIEVETKIEPEKSTAATPTTGDLFVGLQEETGLVMIETSSDKKVQFGTGAPEEPVLRGRKPRQATVIANEPLQQVETSKD
ncbi:MAG: ribonuclease E/G, partial [Azoarcus sp.]|nr:ribonuclease E/G [Azoarcus sp.]